MGIPVLMSSDMGGRVEVLRRSDMVRLMGVDSGRIRALPWLVAVLFSKMTWPARWGIEAESLSRPCLRVVSISVGCTFSSRVKKSESNVYRLTIGTLPKTS